MNRVNAVRLAGITTMRIGIRTVYWTLVQYGKCEPRQAARKTSGLGRETETRRRRNRKIDPHTVILGNRNEVDNEERVYLLRHHSCVGSSSKIATISV
jgi:hypothetical protein